MGGRKWLAVIGYGLSAIVKPFFYIASTWELIAGVRWGDRVGKGIRTAPRDALVADSVTAETRGLAFGFHRAMDTAGALVGILIAVVVGVAGAEEHAGAFKAHLPDGGVDQPAAGVSGGAIAHASARRMWRSRGRGPRRNSPCAAWAGRSASFWSSSASSRWATRRMHFLVLRAQNLGISVIGILIMLAMFNLIYSLISTPAGSLSDRIGRRRLIIGGWLVYAVIYFGFALAQSAWQVWLLYVVYGLYYGMAYGSANALVADLVPENLRGTAYGTYNAVIGLLAFPSSLIAGILWQGAGAWSGFGPSAPFLFGGALQRFAGRRMDDVRRQLRAS